MLSIGQKLRMIADSGHPEQEELFERFKEEVSCNVERNLLLAFAEAANNGNCHLEMGSSLPPGELFGEDIHFLATNRGLVAYW